MITKLCEPISETIFVAPSLVSILVVWLGARLFFVNLKFFWHNAKMVLFYYSEDFAKSPFRVEFSK